MRALTWICRLALVVCLVASSLSGASLYEQDYPSGQFRADGEIHPNVTLPSHIPAPSGQLTCYTDFAAQKDNTVPLYLVNRTEKTVALSSQDGDVMLKLECARPDGSWQRAQAHLASTCGNSYYEVFLPVGQYLLVRGYLPDYGTPAKVRFARYASDGVPLVSNVGEGFVLERDIADADDDFIGRRICQSLDNLLESGFDGTPNSNVDPSRRIAALRLMQAAGTNPHYEKVAAALAQFWESETSEDSARKRAARDIRSLLEKPSIKPRDFDGLFDRCLTALLNPASHDGDFGWPEAHPDLVWNVLSDLAEARKIPETEKWKPLFDDVIQHPDGNRPSRMVRLISLPRLANELLPTEFLEKILYVPDPELQSICAGIIAQRGQWDYLIYAGWRLSPEGQLAILWALAKKDFAVFDGRVRNPDSGDEEAFWNYCLRTQPSAALEKLANASRGEDLQSRPYGSSVHRAVRDFLMQAGSEKARPDFALDAAGNFLSQALQFLASWNAEEDNSIFLKFLEHGGYRKGEVWRNEGIRHAISYNYPLRQTAKSILLQRGQPLPASLVTEKEVPF